MLVSLVLERRILKGKGETLVSFEGNATRTKLVELLPVITTVLEENVRIPGSNQGLGEFVRKGGRVIFRDGLREAE